MPLVRRPQLQTNKWLAIQHLDKGIPLADLRAEWRKRHERETGYKTICTADSMTKAIDRERIRRQHHD